MGRSDYDRASVYGVFTARDKRRSADKISAKQARSCHGKTIFPSKRAANGKARTIDGGMMGYKCKLCRRWHIGHSNRRIA